MGMAGPNAVEWLNACTERAKFIPATGLIETPQEDWFNLVSAAMKAYDITDEELADLNTPAALSKEDTDE